MIANGPVALVRISMTPTDCCRAYMRQSLSFAATMIVMLCALAIAGCASIERLPAVPAADTTRALPLGLANARFFLEQHSAIVAEGENAIERRRQALGLSASDQLPTARFLAVSGGGDEGAFASGLLTGWTEAGDRPEFDVVTGVSTGTMIAPFAFLGREYDPQLRQTYTTISTDNVLIKRGIIHGLLSDAFADTTPLWNMISHFVDVPLMNAIAREYKKGRLLLIGTTDLDAEEPCIWNIGAIAASGHPGALDLIRKVLLASAAVPGAFPPVMIDVALDGKSYQELHVDGGAVAQIFLYPEGIELNRYYKSQEREAFLIRNNREDPSWQQVERDTLTISGRAISSMLHSSGENDLARIYFITQRDSVAYNLAYIDKNFAAKHPAELFDKTYMNALFDYAHQEARHGYAWRKIPPILATPESKQ